MRKNDSLELKIIRTAMPLLIYYGILLLVQTIFGVYAMVNKFAGIEKSNTETYLLAYNFFDNTEEYIKSHSLIATFIAAGIAIFILLFMMKREFGDTIVNGYEKIGWREVLIFGFMGIFIATGLGRLVNLFPIDNLLGSYEEVSAEFVNNPVIFQILTLCIMSPVVEEIIFRGIMYRRLLDYVDKVMAVIITAVIFGVYHGNLIQGIYALILGILLCFVYDSCESLLAPIFVHMACNTVALLMMYLSVSRYISYNMLLNIVVMLLELFGMVFFTWRLYNLKYLEKEGEE